jgi:hypothetical protein
MTAQDPQEVADLEVAAAWRLRKVDADPGDRKSAAAARRLEKLAEELRHLQSSPLYRDYGAICNWLAEHHNHRRIATLGKNNGWAEIDLRPLQRNISPVARLAVRDQDKWKRSRSGGTQDESLERLGMSIGGMDRELQRQTRQSRKGGHLAGGRGDRQQ